MNDYHIYLEVAQLVLSGFIIPVMLILNKIRMDIAQGKAELEKHIAEDDIIQSDLRQKVDRLEAWRFNGR